MQILKMNSKFNFLFFTFPTLTYLPHCITPKALYVWFLLTETMKTSQPPDNIR
jgi:hypothetical protein